MKNATLLALVLGLCVSTGCNKKARYVDPDARSKVEGTGIEARDVRAVVDQMSTELIGSNLIKQFEGVPRMAVMPVENRSRFLIDQEIFTTLIQDQLVQGSAGKLAIVNRDLVNEIVAEREAKRKGEVDSQGFKALSGVEFFLEGELRSLSASTNKAQTDYVIVRFSLTDAESGVIGWSNSYEMKKEGSWGVLYQ
jgi:PBP1b-binding outer membrane lipoprotein LpoB